MHIFLKLKFYKSENHFLFIFITLEKKIVSQEEKQQVVNRKRTKNITEDSLDNTDQTLVLRLSDTESDSDSAVTARGGKYFSNFRFLILLLMF